MGFADSAEVERTFKLFAAIVKDAQGQKGIDKREAYNCRQGIAGDDPHYTVRAWDYSALIETYQTAAEVAREYHIPALVHVIDVTQPQGHSTSGSHERYKTPERLKWEEEFDGLKKMREWMITNRVISAPELDALEKADYDTVEGFRKAAWEAYLAPLTEERNQVMDILEEIASSTPNHVAELRMLRDRLTALPSFSRRDIHSIAHEALRLLLGSVFHRPFEVELLRVGEFARTRYIGSERHQLHHE